MEANNFVAKNGSLKLCGLLPEYKAMLAYFKKWFDAEVVDPEERIPQGI